MNWKKSQRKEQQTFNDMNEKVSFCDLGHLGQPIQNSTFQQSQLLFRDCGLTATETK